MNSSHNIAREAVQASVSDVEWRARQELAACYRLVDRYGMTDLIYNHITLRIPGTEHLLINAYGYLYGEICASNLIKIDLDGNVLLSPQNDHDYEVNRAGMVIHTAIHRTRPDVHCVIHTHTRAGMALSAMPCGLLPMTQTALRFHGKTGYHDFDSPVVELAQQAPLLQSLGGHEVMVLRNHGLLAVGPSVAEAFSRIYWLEMACRTQVDAMAASAEIVLPSQQAIDGTRRAMDARADTFGKREWPALLRLLDRVDESYRF
ncbi:class II aldolase/adducin family protein (plasmid) [Cupriavidus pinatubonensis]|uniref:class II aldolase/adducin family protein n=1 Tax=Cupriavidus pinatubonensis TaxID=248026 RepID=UPI001C73833E|nr:class II aldolase/adducin family protein [Cupriavidus pinatubonensis]QYY33538.1 class II aldolase/adducin family protein [Cupriavidus pinatubonensis]